MTACCMARRSSRADRRGWAPAGGGLLGVLVAILGFVAVLAVVFVGYFVIGGNELS
jgi:hypothetical protein